MWHEELGPLDAEPGGNEGRGAQSPRPRGKSPAARLSVDVHLEPGQRDTLATDVALGFGNTSKSIPPKYFYDELGSKLFDCICDTHEYYQTRTEHALLERIADRIVEPPGPTDIVEFGSGAARKTRMLLDAMERSEQLCRYIPFDVSEAMLRRSAQGLLLDYPWLTVHGVVGDYEQHLDRLPRGERRLFVFLGGTIGNFEPAAAVSFLESVARHFGPGDRLLLGTDLVKAPEVLNAAYNDAAGVTAAFNKNLLSVINRELGAHFDLERFEHVAVYNERESQMEMYLESKDDSEVPIDALGMTARFVRGERILTEISRKFTRESVAELLRLSGLELTQWFISESGYFSISLSRRTRPPRSREALKPDG